MTENNMQLRKGQEEKDKTGKSRMTAKVLQRFLIYFFTV